jgi:uncharacterized protein
MAPNTPYALPSRRWDEMWFCCWANAVVGTFMYMPKHKKITVRAAKNGLGLFSKCVVIKNETIFEVMGVLVSGDAGDTMSESARANLFRYDADSYISPEGNVGAYLNHSCEPNSKVVKRGRKLYVVAIHTIAKGKEVCVDYATIAASDDVWQMRCSCGSIECRKKIGRYIDLPAQLQRSYMRRGVVPEYILEL